MYCSIGKLEFEVEKISLVPNHIGGEIKSSLPKTYDGRAFDYILWLEWRFVNKILLLVCYVVAEVEFFEFLFLKKFSPVWIFSIKNLFLLAC